MAAEEARHRRPLTPAPGGGHEGDEMLITKDFASLQGVYKLHQGDAPGGLMGRVLRKATSTVHPGRMSCEVVLSTAAEDRSGDIVVVKSMELGDHRANPIALFNHDKDAPIGRFQDRDGNYTVRLRDDDTLAGEIFFNQNSDLAHDVFRCVEDKTFSAVSVGFLPVAGKIEKRHTRGHVYHASRLVEGSVLSIGDNPHALIEAVHKAHGRAGASQVFKAYLAPLIAPRAARVAGGWNPPTLRSKAMNAAVPTKKPVAPADPNVAAVEPGSTDEFMPTDDVDPNVDPNAAADPHADHKAVVDDAAGNTAASIFDKVISGQLDRKAGVKLFDKILRHHEEIARLGTEEEGDADDYEEDADPDEELDLDEDADPDDLDEDEAPPPKKAPKEKAFYLQYTPGMEAWITKSFRLANSLKSKLDSGSQISSTKLGRICDELLTEAMGLVPIKKAIDAGVLVTKAPVDSAWREWGASFAANGTH